jgi:NAD(P)-dependent dehydrogenase (short-subunit alcohol dehydrogenase family)
VRQLAGKRVVITGGTSGIGAAAVSRFLDEQSRVLVLDRDQRGCEGSTNGMVGHPMYADYHASKAGVIALTKSMALELAPAGR